MSKNNHFADHTPTPWRIGDAGTAIFAPKELGVKYVAHDLSRANAAFIARACNAHEALVAALEGILRVADRETVEFDAARDALKLAKGE